MLTSSSSRDRESSVIYSYDEKYGRVNESSSDRELYVDVIVSHVIKVKALPELFIPYVELLREQHVQSLGVTCNIHTLYRNDTTENESI